MLVMEDVVLVFAGEVITFGDAGIWFTLTSTGIRVEDHRTIVDFIDTLRPVVIDGKRVMIQSVRTKEEFETQVQFWLEEYNA